MKLTPYLKLSLQNRGRVQARLRMNFWFAYRIASGGPSNVTTRSANNNCYKYDCYEKINNLKSSSAEEACLISLIWITGLRRLVAWPNQTFISFLLTFTKVIFDCYVLKVFINKNYRRSYMHCISAYLESSRCCLHRHHSGFPNGESLQCPGFLQDKYQYLEALPQITVSALKVWCR
jgi:hypothetical protein